MTGRRLNLTASRRPIGREGHSRMPGALNVPWVVRAGIHAHISSDRDGDNLAISWALRRRRCADGRADTRVVGIHVSTRTHRVGLSPTDGGAKG